MSVAGNRHNARPRLVEQRAVGYAAPVFGGGAGRQGGDSLQLDARVSHGPTRIREVRSSPKPIEAPDEHNT
jgi:hypothetical protein